MHDFSVLIRRFCNRIAKSKFTLKGKEYILAINNRPNTLHGGRKSFDKVFTLIDATLIPTGELTAVAGTPFDFLKPYKMGERINDPNDTQIKYEKGYDQSLCIY